jgi:hypothetical protein
MMKRSFNAKLTPPINSFLDNYFTDTLLLNYLVSGFSDEVSKRVRYR